MNTWTAGEGIRAFEGFLALRPFSFPRDPSSHLAEKDGVRAADAELTHVWHRELSHRFQDNVFCVESQDGVVVVLASVVHNRNPNVTCDTFGDRCEVQQLEHIDSQPLQNQSGAVRTGGQMVDL